MSDVPLQRSRSKRARGAKMRRARGMLVFCGILQLHDATARLRMWDRRIGSYCGPKSTAGALRKISCVNRLLFLCPCLTAHRVQRGLAVEPKLTGATWTPKVCRIIAQSL